MVSPIIPKIAPTPGTPSNPIRVQEINLKIRAIFATTITQVNDVINKVKETATHVFSIIQTTPFTNIKVKQLFCALLSGYSFLGARAVAGGIFPTTISSFIAATPLVAISGALFLYAYSLVDYQNPNTLKEIRSNAQAQPLSEVIKKHGWHNLFVHGILPPHAFTTAYYNHVKTLPFNEILAFYERVQNELQKTNRTDYQIPSPSESSQKFFEEIKGLTPTEIVEQYSIEKLNAFALFSADQMNILKEIQSSLKEIDEAKEMFTNTVAAFMKKVHTQSIDARKEAEEALLKARQYEQSIQQLLKRLKNPLEIGEHAPANIKEALADVVATSHGIFHTTAASAKEKIAHLEASFKVNPKPEPKTLQARLELKMPVENALRQRRDYLDGLFKSLFPKSEQG